MRSIVRRASQRLHVRADRIQRSHLLHDAKATRSYVRSIIAAHPIPQGRGTRRTQDCPLWGLISILSENFNSPGQRPTPRGRRSTSYRKVVSENVNFCVVQYLNEEEKESKISRDEPRAQEFLWLRGGVRARPMRAAYASASTGVSPACQGPHERHVVKSFPERDFVGARRKSSLPQHIATLLPTRPSPSRTRPALPTMATTTQIVPRFLLPRLSWTAPLGQQPLVRASIVATQTSNPRPWQDSMQARSAHGGRSSSRLPPKSAFNRVGSPLQQPALRRAFHASPARRREHHFDTLKFVQKLQDEGFTEEQSVAMMKVLNDVIQERWALPQRHLPCPPPP